MTQTIDFRFELLFLFCVLVTLICLLTAIVLGIAKRGAAAKRLLKILGTWWLVYLVIVFLVAATTPQRVIPMDQDLCSDELCFSVVHVQTAGESGAGSGAVRAQGVFEIVTVRASSHARGRPQSERGLQAALWSPKRVYQISPDGQRAWDAQHAENVPLTVRLNPGQSVFSDQVFDVERDDPGDGLVLSNGFTPGFFVIGECPLFHKPTILRLSQ